MRTENGSPPALARRPVTSECVRPLARTLFYEARGLRARIRARVPPTPPELRAPIFIVGCGRSGTTLLGDLLALHPAVNYLYEPYDLWAAIEPATDFVQLYAHGDCHCLLDSRWVTRAAQHRFRRLMSAPAGSTTVEKSPINALRIGYLDALAPDARFVHIFRDGVDVVRSIERIARVTRRIAFRGLMNEWWGVADAKWAALEADGRAAGYYPDEVGLLTSDAQRGAYEWLLSLREVDAWRPRLGSRCIDLRYEDLTDDPRESLVLVTDALGLRCPGWWLERAVPLVRAGRATNGTAVILPDQMRLDFNSLQARLGFKGRAVGSENDGGSEKALVHHTPYSEIHGE